MGLDITNILLSPVLGHGGSDGGEIGGGANEAIFPNPCVDKVREVAVLEFACQRCHIGDIGITAVLLHQLPQGGEGDGAFEVDVELYFGQGVEPGMHYDALSSARTEGRSLCLAQRTQSAKRHFYDVVTDEC